LKSIRVVLADDHILFRQGLARLLHAEPDVEIVGEANNGLEVQAKVDELRPDVVVMDVSMPIIEGIAACRELTRRWPDTKVVILSMYADEGHLFQALKAGAVGYVLKTKGFEEVVSAVRAAADGGGLIASDLTSKVINEFRRVAAKAGVEDGVGHLTETELQMLQLVASGLSNKEIALEMCFADSTVKNRLSVLFQKIGVSDRTQAAIYAITNGLAPLAREGTPGGAGILS
jgi:DNA-binding NarL/FixJ family response regulator